MGKIQKRYSAELQQEMVRLVRAAALGYCSPVQFEKRQAAVA